MCLQIVAIFARLCACSYHELLIAQGAVELLLQIVAPPPTTLQSAPQVRAEFAHRVRYKAAVCLGTIAAYGAGLRALHEHHGLVVLDRVLRTEDHGATSDSAAAPLHLICLSLKQRLQSVYRPLESVV